MLFALTDHQLDSILGVIALIALITSSIFCGAIIYMFEND